MSLPPEDLELVWKDFAHTGSLEARNVLAEHYLPLAQMAAGRIKASTPEWEEYDDILAAGCEGLIEALNHFDTARESEFSLSKQFERYASNRIRGAIYDMLREWDWVPRSTRVRSKAVASAVNDAYQQTGQPASDLDVAKTTGLTVNEVYQARIEVGRSTLVRPAGRRRGDPDRPAASEATGPPVDPFDDWGVHIDPLIEHLAEAIRRLNDRHRTVLALYYLEGLLLEQIATLMGLRVSYISTLKTTALSHVRDFALAKT